MISVSAIIGNIRDDPKLRSRYEEMLRDNRVERIKIARSESQKVRMRKLSDGGTDIGLTLPARTTMRQGDVILLDNQKLVIVEVEPENVMVIEMNFDKSGDDADHFFVPVKVGHTIGNLHRPIKVDSNRIIFPIQSNSEVDMFKKMLEHVKDHLKITTDKIVFEPEEGMDVHEHS